MIRSNLRNSAAASMATLVVACGATAEFTGMVTEATLVDQSGWEGTDPRTLYVVSVYAEFDDAADKLKAVYGTVPVELSVATSDTSGFWQFDANGSAVPGNYNTSDQIHAGLSDIYASVTSDSFVTIGLTNSTGNNMLNIGIDFTSFNDASATSALSVDNGSWFITDDDTQGTAGNYAGLRVLVGQFTVGAGHTVTGSVNLQWWYPPGITSNTTGGTFEGTAPSIIPGNDCNSNGVDDLDEWASCDGSPWCDDCNNNGILDQCDVSDGSSADCDGDGIPDECETDCDGDGVIDDCEQDPDQDGDGVPDCRDGCPNDPNKTEPGVCGCGVADTDSDDDGTLDCNDNCPNDPNKIEPGDCGCGVADTDSDDDGTLDCNDNCPNDPNKIEPGDCGCGVADTDTDGDNTADCNDNCPNDPNKTEPGVCGCGVADTDSDDDGTLDCNDNCPNDPNKTEPGVCGCGVADTDSDDDGTLDCNDNCPNDPDKIEPGDCGCGVADTDTDGDNTADCNDAFPNDPDEWTDSDGDGIGDNSDPCPHWAGDCSSDGHTLYVVPGDVIQDAIYAAVDGGVVELAPGTYYAPADPVENRVVVISGKSVTLHATGTAEETIIDGAGAYGGIVCSWSGASATVIDGLTITGCVAWEGGISCWASSPTIINCTIIGNTATNGHGGGVSCGQQSNPTITNCTITENSAEYGGGIGCQWESNPFITDCTITNNTASMLGGGVSSDTGMTGSNPIMSNTTVCGNSPNQIYGPHSDEGGNSIDAVCEVPCDADTSGDGSVDGTDLTMILSLWGLEIPSADIDGDGLVGIADLLILLESWGACP